MFLRLTALLVLGALPGAVQAQLVRKANTTIQLPTEPVLFSGYTTQNALGSLTFTNPIYTASPPGETNRLFVVERRGRIQLVSNLKTTPVKSEFLNLANVTGVTGLTQSGENGLLSMAFHPDYATNGEFFVFYSFIQDSKLYQRVARLRMQSGNPNAADHSFIEPLITQLDEASNHNGGTVAFGPDGYLYISVGDEGAANDVFDNARRIDRDFFGAILRIDVDRKPGSLAPSTHTQSSAAFPSAVHSGTYTVPADNPFIGSTGWHGAEIQTSTLRTEIWATGLRNPFRFSFDSATGRLFCADVGQEKYEEINLITRGGDYGWSWREGKHAFTNGPDPITPPAGFTPISPVFEYDHTLTNGEPAFGSSITGGVVYRGRAMPELTGKYVFTDYGSGWIMALEESSGKWTARFLTEDLGVAGLGTDPRDGEVLLCMLDGGTVRKLMHTGPPTTVLPATLSATGVFSNTPALTPAPGVVPYDVNAPFWSDHAIKQRWFSLKTTTTKFGFSEQGNWTLPAGAVWIKHFDIDTERGNPATRRRLETRILVKTKSDVYGLSYKWRDDQTEADLVSGSGLNYAIPGSSPAQTWRFPSRVECTSCHTSAAGYALSFHTAQLNRASSTPGYGQQLAALHQAGYLDQKPAVSGLLPAFATATDTTQTLEWRSRSYLSVNCSPCHQPGGAVPSSWDARYHLSLHDTGLVNGVANNSGTDPLNRLIVPGDTAHSILLHRLGATGGFSRMPPIGSNEADADGLALITDWINSNLTDSIEITAHPQPAAISEGGTATFSVTATGTGTLTYQWRKDRVNLPGQTNDTLTVSNATAGDQAGYSVIVTDDNGSEESHAALLEVIGDPPRIIDQPDSLLARVGSTASLSVTALGRPLLKHQWRKSNVSIPGATLPTYSRSNVQLSHAGSHNVLVGGKLLSQNAMLTVVGEATGNLNIVTGGTATLTVPYAGSLPAFAWRKGSNPAVIGTAAKLTIINFSAANEADYFCDVTAHGLTEVLGPYHLHHLLPPANTHAAPPADAIVSGSFNWQLTSSQPATIFIVGKLPPGLTYNALTNRITGTPNASGSVTVRITPKNAAGTGASVDYTITIAPFDFPSGIQHEALVERQADVNDNFGGRVSLATTGTGLVTGRLFHANTSYPLSGRWLSNTTADPVYTATLTRKNDTSLVLSLTLNRSSRQVTGTLVDGANSALVEGEALADWTTVPAADLNAFAAAYYHVTLLPSVGDVGNPAKPQGSGYLRLKGATSGVLSGTGKLPDGTTITVSVQARDPRIILYLPLYAGKGSLWGRMATAAINTTVVGTPAFTGSVDWRKFAAINAADRTYPSPFGVTLQTTGHAYKAPAATLNVLGGPDAPDNADLEFSEAAISSVAQAADLDQLFRLNAASIAVFNAAVNPTGVKLAIDKTTGLFSGSFLLTDGLIKRPVNYFGIIADEEGHGYFLLPGIPTATAPILSGKVWLHRSATAPSASGYSVRFFGTGATEADRVKIKLDAPAKAVDVATADFTIEFWLKATSGTNTQPIITPGANADWINGNIILDNDTYGAPDTGDYGFSLCGGLVAFGCETAAGARTILGSTSVVDGTWHHIALTRSSSTGLLKLWVDGVPDASGTGPTGNMSYRNNRTTLWPNDPFIVLGAEKHNLASWEDNAFNGWLDEIRFSNRIRYTAPFTPPTAPFTPDTFTASLYHLDEGTGTIIFDAATGASHGTRLTGGAQNGPAHDLDTPF